MDAPGTLDTALRLGVCTLLSALIGLERELRGRPAGLRTHILVGNGACLLSMVSEVVGAEGDLGDPGRIAAAVVTGIGFLGAGAIIRHGNTVQGLTTAASIWVTAASGVAAGIGWFEGAALVTLFSLVALLSLRAVENLWSKEPVQITVVARAVPEEPMVTDALFVRYGVTPSRAKRVTSQDGGEVTITAHIEGLRRAARLVRDLNKQGFVESVRAKPELD